MRCIYNFAGAGVPTAQTYERMAQRQIKIILMNNRRPLFRRAYRGGDEKIILILIWITNHNRPITEDVKGEP